MLRPRSELRRAIYRMPVVHVAERAASVVWQMQRLFCELQTAARAPDTRVLSRLLGWTEEEEEEQASPPPQDVHELRTK